MQEFIGNGILLADSKLVLFGAPKSFKSILAMQMALTASAGSGWLGFPPSTKPLRCYFIQGEIPRVAFRNRLVKMSGNCLPAPNVLFTKTDFKLRLDTMAAFQTLEREIQQIRPDILFLDPLYKLLSTQDDITMARFFDNLDHIIEKYSLSVVIVAHDRKPQVDDRGRVLNLGGADLRGPRTLEGWFETIIRLDGNISTDQRVLSFEMRHGETSIPPLPVNLDRSKLWMVKRIQERGE
jgi:RecA-family ATPase